MHHKRLHPQDQPHLSKATEDEICRCRDEFFAVILLQIERLNHTELQKGWPPNHIVLQAMSATLGLLLASWLTLRGIQEDIAHKESIKLVESLLSGANNVADRLLQQTETN